MSFNNHIDQIIILQGETDLKYSSRFGITDPLYEGVSAVEFISKKIQKAVINTLKNNKNYVRELNTDDMKKIWCHTQMAKVTS